MNASQILADLSAWPKLDLHRHLEGTVRPATVLELYRKNQGKFMHHKLDDLLPLIQVTGQEKDLFDFLAKFEVIMPCLKTTEDLERVTLEAVEDAWRDGVRYLELRYCPHFIAQYSGMSPYDAAQAVAIGRENAERLYPVLVEITHIIPQYGGKKIGEETLDLAMAFRKDGASSVDVAGDIRQFPLEEYQTVFDRAVRENLGITIHAGEITPADTVALAVEKLHATRIGHGIRAIDDMGVINLLREREVLLEVCVTSNLQTRAVGALDEHPIRKLHDLGVMVSINSDDPGISNLRLSEDYHTLLSNGIFSADEIRAINRRAVSHAFTTPERKERILSNID